MAEQKASNIDVRDGVTEDQFVAMRQASDATLKVPTLILSSMQVNVGVGHLSPADENGVSYLRIPLNALPVHGRQVFKTAGCRIWAYGWILRDGCSFREIASRPRGARLFDSRSRWWRCKADVPNRRPAACLALECVVRRPAFGQRRRCMPSHLRRHEHGTTFSRQFHGFF